MSPTRRSLLWLWSVAALGGLAWGLIAVVFASIGPSQYVPRVFYSYHVEHFAAFYIIVILAAAGLPNIKLHDITFSAMMMAVILATVRLAIPRHRLFDLEDLGADVAGILAGVVPMFIENSTQISSGEKSRVRQIARAISA